MNDLVNKAQTFAAAAHAAVGQKRKYTNEPYIVHPMEVASIVASVDGNEEMVAAAWLHDVVEDTSIDIWTIGVMFTDTVASYVNYLTDISKPEDGDRAIRKAIDCKHIAKAPKEVKTIKLADLISNTSSIVEYDPKFAKIYLEEKKLLLKVLTEGDKTLYKRAYKLAYGE